MSNGGWSIPTDYGIGSPTSSDGTDWSVPADFTGGGGGSADGGTSAGDYYGPPGSAGGLANFGSNLGGLAPSLLGSTGAGTSVSTTRRKTRGGHYLMGGAVYRHRMNSLNPKALRRAISRITSFEHFARRVLKISSPHQHVHGFKKRRKRSRW